MSNIKKAIALSGRIAASLLGDKKTASLEETELFDEQDKQYVLDHLTDERRIKERLDLTGNINRKEDWKKLRSKMEVPVRKMYLWQYAAAVVLFFGLTVSYFFRDTLFYSPQPAPMIRIEAGTDKATLTLGDGKEVILEKGSVYRSENARSNGDHIVYEKVSGDGEERTGSEEIAYNYLTIPRGGQFYVLLSDSTEVWLNSESRLKYPVRFAEGEPREVELEYGEAYFDVSPVSKHRNSAFKVKSRGQTVEVLGTEFNIKAYRDEEQVRTTLAEGKVMVNKGTRNRTISPGQQSVTGVATESLEVHTVSVAQEIAWKNGMFIFDNMSLEKIMTILSRWYNIEVKFEDDAKKDIVFSGALSRSESVNTLLNKIERIGCVSFQLSDKTLFIK